MKVSRHSYLVTNIKIEFSFQFSAQLRLHRSCALSIFFLSSFFFRRKLLEPWACWRWLQPKSGEMISKVKWKSIFSVSTWSALIAPWLIRRERKERSPKKKSQNWILHKTHARPQYSFSLSMSACRLSVDGSHHTRVKSPVRSEHRAKHDGGKKVHNTQNSLGSPSFTLAGRKRQLSCRSICNQNSWLRRKSWWIWSERMEFSHVSHNLAARAALLREIKV